MKTIAILIVFVSINIKAYSQSGWFWQNAFLQGTQSDVFFIDSNTCWAVGNGGSILRTTNGGTIWLSQTSGSSKTRCQTK